MKLKLTAAILAISITQASAQIYTEDFNNLSTLPNSQHETFGFFNGNGTFDQIVVSQSSSIVNDTLVVTSTNGFRGIGIAIDPNTLQGAGTYTFSFDVLEFLDNGNSGNSIEVSVWEGSGYDNGNNADHILFDAIDNELTAGGNAVANFVTSQSYNSAGNDQSITFTHDGSSAVAIFLGVETSGFPFPEATFDNLFLEGTDSSFSIPEPSTTLLGALGLAVMTFCRKRL